MTLALVCPRTWCANWERQNPVNHMSRTITTWKVVIRIAESFGQRFAPRLVADVLLPVERVRSRSSHHYLEDRPCTVFLAVPLRSSTGPVPHTAPRKCDGSCQTIMALPSRTRPSAAQSGPRCPGRPASASAQHGPTLPVVPTWSSAVLSSQSPRLRWLPQNLGQLWVSLRLI